MKKLILLPLMLLGLSGCVWYGPGGWYDHGYDGGWHGGWHGHHGGDWH
ncbi:MAG TPA: hypothetical protein VMH92_06590 [Acidocella sp.]|nr:hypothetical protein [Acidocella sp.]